ncbi:flagellin N-terminal helical domain-containing protein [Dongshaea marina]|uniref:flagellin N-terminal helical domain-containing protein n=1 Tax=Dongshaea marina TaxID=2047966 RepID=UPI00131F2A36|nr:flagellin [Dongshaea marina]
MVTINSMVSNATSFLQLQRAQQVLFNSAEKLTSGKRINSAADDPAGLAIVNRMNSQIRGDNQAIRNANDGISMTQVADGALASADSILQRMRELAVQAGNSTLSESNRRAIQSELGMLSDELASIGSQTQFNGINVFKNQGSLNFQVGFNSSVQLNMGGLTGNTLEQGISAARGDLNGGRVEAATSGIAAGSVTINGVDLGALTASSGGDADLKADLINQQTGLTGVTASASNLIEGQAVAADTSVGQGIQVTIGGTTTTLNGAASVDDFVAQFNQEVAGAQASITASGAIQIFNDTGKDITLTDNALGDLGQLGLEAGTFGGSIALSSATGDPIQVGLSASGSFEDLRAFGFNQQTGASQLTGGEVSGQAITSADGIEINGVALGALGTLGSELGADELAQAINSISDQSGVTASASNQLDLSVDLSGLQNNSALELNGVFVFSGFSVTSLGDAINTINAAGISGITASATTEGELRLSSSSGASINIENGDTAFSQEGSAISSSLTQRGQLTLEGEDGREVNISSSAAIGQQQAALDKLGLSDVGGFSTDTGNNVASVENAGSLIANIDRLSAELTQARSALGATQNRFVSTVNGLSDSIIQNSAARSRIEDADMARSISEFLQAQVAQQAGLIIQAQSQKAERGVIFSLLRS